MNRIPDRYLQEWVYVLGVMQNHLARGNGPPVDDFDRDNFSECFAELKHRVEAGQLDRTSPEVHRIGFAIRNKGFRPTYERLQEIVREVLGIPEPVEPLIVEGHVAEERRVHSAPSQYLLPSGRKSTPARDNAIALIRKLNQQTKGRHHSHGPERWTGHGEDPLAKVPREYHEDLIADALHELNQTGKGRHPNHIRAVAGRIWRDRQREPVTAEYVEDTEEIFS